MFNIEYQNKLTNWAWKPAVYQPQEIEGVIYNGVTFNDLFILADYSTIYPFYTWVNIRFKADINLERINFWAAKHNNPNVLDTNGVTLQSGDEQSTYATYENIGNKFKNSDRFYFWIKATNQDENYSISQSLYDNEMALHAVSSKDDISVPNNEYRIINESPSWLSWNPRTDLLGTTGDQNLVYKIAADSNKNDIARWIMGWDNCCVNIQTSMKDPLNPIFNGCSIADSFGMIEGLNSNQVWLNCAKDKYIYGKLLYCLEDHDFVNRNLLVANGIKSCGIEGFGVYYG